MKTDRIVIVQGSETGFRVTVMDGTLKVLASDPPVNQAPESVNPVMPGKPEEPVPPEDSVPGVAQPAPAPWSDNPLAAIKRLKNIKGQLGELETTFTESIAMRMNATPKILIPAPQDSDYIVGKWSAGLESVREAMLDVTYLIARLTATLPPDTQAPTETV